MVIQILLIQIATFVGLVLVLRLLFYRQLNAALNRLKGLHEDNLKKELVLKNEIEATKKQREKELLKAQEEAAAIIKEARVKAERLVNEMQINAAVQIEAAVEQNAATLQALQDDLLERQGQQVIESSHELFKLILTVGGKENFHRALVVELIREISAIEKSGFPVPAPAVDISCAYPLEAGEKQRLQEILNEKTGGIPGIREAVDESLIAGLVLQLGPMTIDGSLRNRLRKAAELLKSAKTKIE